MGLFGRKLAIKNLIINLISTKSKKLSGTNYSEVYKKAFGLYKQIESQSKRRTYIRSAYFKKDKIFLGPFWQHLHSKLSHKDKTRRLKYFHCAIELIKYSHFEPSSKDDPDKKSGILHRFTGITANNEIFFVQIKESKNTREKYFISVFPLD